MKKAGLWFVAAFLCLAYLLSIPSIAAESENNTAYGPGFINGVPLNEVVEAENKTETETETSEDKEEIKTDADIFSEEGKNYKKGESLGKFMTVGYFGDGLTYSGKAPKSKHTISADLTVLPLGTKVIFNGCLYTVEDKGSGVKGKMIDIYFDTRDEAVALTWTDRKYAEVYIAEEVK